MPALKQIRIKDGIATLRTWQGLFGFLKSLTFSTIVVIVWIVVGEEFFGCG
jgi:hypothetical protein